MNIEEKAFLWLNMCDFIGHKKAFGLIEKYGSATKVMEHIDDLKDTLKPGDYEKAKYLANIGYIDTFVKNCNNQGIGIVTYASNEYPTSLKDIDTPPLALYTRGDVSLLKSNCIAIVGTRRITKYGTEVTTMFSTALSKAGLTIVSGLSYGVDAVAHSACLNAKGKTIAVLGSGLNVIYPDANKPLADKIVANGGLVISEYKPNEKSRTYYFPVRNRIIAALSKGVLIPEATLKSGSMHTKNYALDYGKDLFVVPGRITDIYSVGCNSVIKSLQGAMVLSPDDILEHYNLKGEKILSNAIQLSLDEEMILSILGTNELHYEELLEKSGMEARVLNTMLVKLELKKIITKLPGNYYSK